MLSPFSFTPFVLGFYILITWAACATALIGIGSLLLRPLVGDHRPLEAFWAGLFVAVALLQIGHFLVPIAWPFTAFLGGLGLLGLLWHGRKFLSGDPPLRGNASSLTWSLILTAAIALRCAGPCNHYDTGFYGAMEVRWFNTYPLVPGLANLMAQFGYNSSVFLCVAGLNHGPWKGLAFHLFGGLLLSALAFTIVPAFFRVWRGVSSAPADLFLTILVVPGLFWLTNSQIIGTNSDLPTTFMALSAFAALLGSYATPETTDHTTQRSAVALFLALLLFPLAISFKISSAVFAFLGWVFAFAQLRHLALPPRARRKLMLAAIVLPTVLLLTWSARGFVTSGYPFFPSGILHIPVDWRVPQQWAELHERGVRSWARMSGAPLSQTEGWHWVGAWSRAVVRDRVNFIFPALLCVAGLVTLLRRAELRAARWLVLLVPSVCGLVFWFVSAPAPRFVEFVVWSTAGTFGTVTLAAVLPALGGKARRALLLGFVAIGLWCSYPRTIWRVFYRPAFVQKELPRVPQAPLAPFKVDENLTVLVPFKKDQCWDAPLPCSPYFFDSLRLRRDSDLSSGFLDRTASGKVDKFSAFHKLYWTGPEPERDEW